MALVACGGPAPEAVEEPEAESLALDFELAPEVDGLALRLSDGDVRVGDLMEVAATAAEMPPGAFETYQLPPDLPEHVSGRWSSQGWVRSEGSFGLIGLDGRVALALRQWEGLDDSVADRRMEDLIPGDVFTRELAEVENAETRYRFFERDGVRLMIVRSMDADGSPYMAAIVGKVELMDGLRMNPAEAAEDAARAEMAREG